MTPTCIDLRPVCQSRRWRWRYEESFHAEGMRSTNPDAAWYVEVLCRNGIVYPFGGDDLLVCIEQHAKVLSRLHNIGPAVRPHQGFSVLRFPFHLLDQVMEVMKPKHISGRFATDADVERLSKTGFRRGNRLSESREWSEGMRL